MQASRSSGRVLIGTLIALVLGGCGGGGGGSPSAAPTTTPGTAAAAAPFLLTASVTGLDDGGSLSVTLNGTALPPISSNGVSVLTNSLADGASYAVLLSGVSSAPSYDCTLAQGAGTARSGATAAVNIQCRLRMLAVGGQVIGLKGQGLVLRLDPSQTLAVGASSSFQFANAVASGQRYAVSVAAQPTAPAQVCSVSRNTGWVTNQAVTDIQVVCADELRRVSGQVSGLLGTGLSLQLNAEPAAPVQGNGRFEFQTPLADQSGYQVTVKGQPQNPSQVCSVSNGSGYATAAQSTDPFVVNCATAAFSVGGSVAGLKGSGLVLQNNGGDDLVVDRAGFFSFAKTVPSGARYALSVRQQPWAPAQVCNTASAGTVQDAPVNDAQVTCVDKAFPVPVRVDGLGSQTLVLQNNSGDDLLVNGDGDYRFNTPIAAGASYSVTVKQGPAEAMLACAFDQRDTISGLMPDAGLGARRIRCYRIAPQISFTVHGLLGDQVSLSASANSALKVTQDGQYTFANAPFTGEPYAVTVQRQPRRPAQLCTVNNGTGVMTAQHVTNVAVECGAALAPLFRIGSSDDDVVVQRLDRKTGAVLATAYKQVMERTPGTVIGITNVAARPAGQYVNIHALQGSLIHTLRFDSESEELTTLGTPLPVPVPLPGQPFYLRLSPDGRFLFVTTVGQYGHVRIVVDPTTGMLSNPTFVSASLSNELTFDSQGLHVYSEGGWLGATAYDAVTGTFGAAASSVLMYRPFAMSPNGKWMLATGSNRDMAGVLAVDPVSGGALLTPAPPTVLKNAELGAVALFPTGRAALVAYRDLVDFRYYVQLLKLNPDTGQLIQAASPVATSKLTRLAVDPTEAFALGSVEACDPYSPCENKRLAVDLDRMQVVVQGDDLSRGSRFVIVDTSTAWTSAAKSRTRPPAQR